nr:gamma-glutamyl-gamma-aminobutyrate hydrolase family protein [Lentibacillus amyloliquefaciens]
MKRLHYSGTKKAYFCHCRGNTVLNVALGGTVIQDIETKIPQAISHYQQAERHDATHDIQIEENCRLYDIFNKSSIRVNSINHQAIDKLGSSLKTAAAAPDGIIAAVEAVDQSSSLFMGVQWNPEEMASEDPYMQGFFKTFIYECSNKDITVD